MEGLGLIPGTARFFLLHSVQTASGAHPASYPVDTGGGALFPELKWQERKTGPPFNVEVNNGGAITPLPHVFMEQDLTRHELSASQLQFSVQLP
jgi:hypothetical protein